MSVDQPQPRTLAPRTLEQDQILLDELADLGLDFARDLKPAPHARDQAAARSTAFECVARTVRRTVLLKHHLPKIIATPLADPAAIIAAARRIIVRDVEDAIEFKAEDEHEAAKLEAELVDRIDTPDIDDDIFRRPIAEIVAAICRDLGIASHTMTRPGFGPGRRRSPEDVRILCHRAAKTFTGPATTTPRPPRRPIPPPPRLSPPIPIRRVRTQADEPLIEARLREAGRRREQTNDS